MERQFSTRTTTAQYILLLLFTSLLIYGIWEHKSFLILIFSILNILLIERIIHSCYIVTDDNKLIINYGRFQKKNIIRLEDIKEISYAAYLMIGGKRIGKFIMIIMKNSKYKVSLFPTNEKEFVRYVLKKTDTYHPNIITKKAKHENGNIVIYQKDRKVELLKTETTFPPIDNYDNREAYMWSIIYLSQYKGRCILDMLEEYMQFMPHQYPLSIGEIQQFDKEIVKSNLCPSELVDKVYYYMKKAKTKQ